MARYKGDLDLTIYQDNPLLYWAKIQECHETGQPLPDEVMDYLSRAAISLLEIRKPNKEAAGKVQDALELNPATCFEDYHTRVRRQGLGPYLFAFRIYLRVMNKRYFFIEGRPLEKIFLERDIPTIKGLLDKARRVPLDFFFAAVAA